MSADTVGKTPVCSVHLKLIHEDHSLVEECTAVKVGTFQWTA